MDPSSRLKALRNEVKTCRKCSLWKTRKNAVFDEGPVDARIMLVGLGPGKQEDLQGRPFVGAAGKLLDELIKEAGLNRERLYITNVLKCFLPENRATEEQIKACAPYLDEQIDLVSPEVLVPLGNVAANYLLKKFGMEPAPMEEIHGKFFRASMLTQSMLIVPMYHPASALRNPPLRNVLFEDWREFGSRLRSLGIVP
ncbi:MAG: uracil-DNA glycosylase [Thaumarchaeota archaeon]|nr:uracil-DNA glycosylase [Candidatus Terraquivivens yellowstonensis]MCL7387787.1 uracil-DNA glycosylase [Candidatus Terraquivivens yellowstonensis]MCL7392245.1 uracil-DNA glycosylase [Candidatus Terraquivivens yellowstonensis]MCL7395279.1 uracil-DNA glycosylase [Candidatus Terraquivivens yellowstonensis]MCL7397480.1 uracil-DNA glycosylase [Candidatus Terraquivivens yellowstonensis]